MAVFRHELRPNVFETNGFIGDVGFANQATGCNRSPSYCQLNSAASTNHDLSLPVGTLQSMYVRFSSSDEYKNDHMGKRYMYSSKVHKTGPVF
jgi:hypothetical protein